MGAVSETLATALRHLGGDIFTEAEVDKVVVVGNKATGVHLKSGQEVAAKIVLSNATTRETLLNLVTTGTLDSQLVAQVNTIDYTSSVVKVNVALSRIPDFARNGLGVQPHHRCSIHLNCEDMSVLNEAHKDFVAGRVSSNPMIEVCQNFSFNSVGCIDYKYYYCTS